MPSCVSAQMWIWHQVNLVLSQSGSVYIQARAISEMPNANYNSTIRNAAQEATKKEINSRLFHKIMSFEKKKHKNFRPLFIHASVTFRNADTFCVSVPELPLAEHTFLWMFPRRSSRKQQPNKKCFGVISGHESLLVIKQRRIPRWWKFLPPLAPSFGQRSCTREIKLESEVTEMERICGEASSSAINLSQSKY